MADPLPLFQVNPDLDTGALAERFAAQGRVRVPDVLTPASAEVLHDVLVTKTPWGLAWQAGEDGPHAIRSDELTLEARRTAARAVGAALAAGDFAFCYAQYPMLKAYQEGWAPGGPHELLLEHVNDQPFLDLARAITGVTELVKVDAQATLFGPGHFLSTHDDTGEDTEGRRVAYVLSMCRPASGRVWRPRLGRAAVVPGRGRRRVRRLQPRLQHTEPVHRALPPHRQRRHPRRPARPLRAHGLAARSVSGR